MAGERGRAGVVDATVRQVWATPAHTSRCLSTSGPCPCRMGLGIGVYWAVQPPSTGIAWPVTKDAASEQSQTTVSPISSGRPILPEGDRPATQGSRPGSSSMSSLHGGGGDVGGADGVDSYTFVGVFEGGSLGQTNNPVLASDVSGCADRSGNTVNRRCVYDGTGALPEHYRNLAPHAVPDAVQVYFDYVQPVLARQPGGSWAGP